MSDKSTTDNFLSEDDEGRKKLKSKMQRKPVKTNDKSRVSGKFYWYTPLQMERKKKPIIKIVDDVSSESSIEDEREEEMFEGFLEESYYNSFLYFQQMALNRNHVVDTFNFNPDHQW